MYTNQTSLLPGKLQWAESNYHLNSEFEYLNFKRKGIGSRYDIVTTYRFNNQIGTGVCILHDSQRHSGVE